jgi:RNA polymerase sigma-70 factor (ECF subfamily)
MWLKATIRATGYAPEAVGGRSAMSPDEPDERLIRQAESGNAQAFEKLSTRYDEAILALLLMLTSSEPEALELCHATFRAAYQRLARRKTESLYIWLYRLAAAQWLDWANQRAARTPAAAGAVEQLSARERLVFTLKAGQHLALRTVAQILDASEETVARTFSRAVCKLQLSARKAD